MGDTEYGSPPPQQIKVNTQSYWQLFPVVGVRHLGYNTIKKNKKKRNPTASVHHGEECRGIQQEHAARIELMVRITPLPDPGRISSGRTYTRGNGAKKNPPKNTSPRLWGPHHSVFPLQRGNVWHLHHIYIEWGRIQSSPITELRLRAPGRAHELSLHRWRLTHWFTPNNTLFFFFFYI